MGPRGARHGGGPGGPGRLPPLRPPPERGALAPPPRGANRRGEADALRRDLPFASPLEPLRREGAPVARGGRPRMELPRVLPRQGGAGRDLRPNREGAPWGR